MYKTILGYMEGNIKWPIYAPMPGQLVTQALIHCSQCRVMISGNMGPRNDAWCVPCTDEGIKATAKEKVVARKKAAAEKIAAKKKIELEAAAKKKADAEAENRRI